jgi:cell division protein FtsL
MSAMMPKTEQYEMRQPWSKVLLKIALIVVILLVSLLITASAVNLTIYGAYKRYVDNFSQVTRLDPHLANLVFVLFLVPAFFDSIMSSAP